VIEIDDILAQCGVTKTTLSALEQDALDRDGYFIAAGLVDARWLGSLRAGFEDAGAKGGHGPVTNDSGTRHISDLVNRDEVFVGVYMHPKILAAVYHVLGCGFRLGQINGRDPLPGYGQQGLHADWPARSKGEPFRIVTVIWLLDDFTADNGATRLVPGTHLLLTPPPKSLGAPSNRHPDQKVIVAKAGSVLVFNGHLWHSGTANKSKANRRVLQCSYVGQEEYRFSRITVENPERLSATVRYVLGV
jgi:ectoine hydroxylase-related dioxygenase (phytanoyl-CoA dioxygenase family)